MNSHIKNFQDFLNEGQFKDMSYLFSQWKEFKGRPLVQELMVIDQLFGDHIPTVDSRARGNTADAFHDWQAYSHKLFKKHNTWGWDNIQDPKVLQDAILHGNKLLKKHGVSGGREDHYFK